MRIRNAVLIALFVLGVFVTLAVRYYPHFPGDVVLSRFVQSLVPKSMRWAQWISLTATFPWSLFLLAATFALSWAIAGWRVAMLSLFSFAGMWALGAWLNPAMARPRPSPELVHVVGTPTGYSFPSNFALTYASTFGFLAILALVRTSGKSRMGLLILGSVLLVIGGVARIALGAHWPSDIAISYFLGLLWAIFLIRFVYGP